MAINQQMIEGSWNQVKGKVRQRWGQLSDDELEQARGDMDLLVGVIQEKTGVLRSEVESYLESAVSEGASAVGRATDAVVGQVQHAAESAQRVASKAADSARAGYIQTERMVRDRPIESLSVCFATGLITGIVVGLLLRSR